MRKTTDHQQSKLRNYRALLCKIILEVSFKSFFLVFQICIRGEQFSLSCPVNAKMTRIIYYLPFLAIDGKTSYARSPSIHSGYKQPASIQGQPLPVQLTFSTSCRSVSESHHWFFSSFCAPHEKQEIVIWWSHGSQGFCRGFIQSHLMEPLSHHPGKVCVEIIRVHKYRFAALCDLLHPVKGDESFTVFHKRHDIQLHLSLNRSGSQNPTDWYVNPGGSSGLSCKKIIRDFGLVFVPCTT